MQNTSGTFSIPTSAIPVTGDPIAEIFFDTTGVPDGASVIFGVNGNGPFPGVGNTNFFNNGVAIDTFSALTLEFGVSAPEPSSAGILLALGGVVAMRRKRA